MRSKPWMFVAVVVVFSMVLGACAPKPTATPVPKPTAKPAEKPTEAPTAAPPPVEKVKIVLWEQEADDVDVFLDELIADFMAKNPNIEVERTHYGNEELRDQFQTAGLAGAGPDLARCPNDFAGPFSTLELLAPVKDVFDEAFLDQFFAGALGPAAVGGVLWGVPDNYGNHLMLLYNKDLLAEAPKDTDEMIEVAKGLTKGEQYGLVFNLNEPFWLAPWIGGFGGWPLDDATDMPTLGTKAVADALQFVHDLKFEHQIVPIECDYDTADTLFKEGKAAMLINGDWSLGGYKEAGLNFGTAPIPKVSATGLYPSPMTAGKYYMINKAVLGDSAKVEAVKIFLTYMTSAEVQKQWLDKFSRLPSSKEVAKDPSISSDPILAGSMAQLSYGKGMPAAPQMRCAWDAMRPNLEAVMADSATAQEAAAAMQEEGMRCVQEAGLAPTEKVTFKVGMITDVGGIDDKSFNATSWKGVADAIRELGVEGQYLESQQQTDYAKNITEFLQQGYDMLVTVGFLLGDDTAKFGQENPDVPFAIVDYAYDPTIPNVLGLTFATDEAAFLAGYLAAGMTKTGKVGQFGGIEIPPVTIFMLGFEAGVNHYNAKHGTSVEVLGTSYFVGNFESTDDGRRAGESLMDEGADIVMPVAGPVGLGTAAAVQERGGMLIGVDTDWYVSAPEYQDIMLTSVLKNMDVAVYTAIESAMKGTFEGGVYVGTLVNDGVGIAPFHDYDAGVSAELKAELEEIKKGIIDGAIWTGWGEKPAPKVTGEPVTLTFWHTQEPEQFRGKLLNGMIEDFQKEYPWITIESSYQGNYTDLYRKMMATIAAGEMPDFAVAYPSQIAEYMQADAVVPLDAYISDAEIGLTEDDLKDIFPGYLAECRFQQFDNQYLAFPFTKSYVGMWYNMDLLRAAGWDHVPTTWAEFEQACNDVTDKTDARGYAFYESASTFDAWLFSRGAEQLNADQTEAVFNGPEAVESLEMMLRLIETGGAWKPEGSYADQASFGQGDAAFTMSSTSGTYYYRKAVEESGTGPKEWGQALLPQSDPSNPKTVMYGASICVFKTTEAKQRAAWLFIKWFSDTAQTAKWSSQSGYMPVRASSAALLDEYFAGEPIAKEQFEKIVPYGKPEPNVRGEQEIRDFLYDAMVAAFSEVATPQEALDEAVELANEALARGRE